MTPEYDDEADAAWLAHVTSIEPSDHLGRVIAPGPKKARRETTPGPLSRLQPGEVVYSRRHKWYGLIESMRYGVVTILVVPERTPKYDPMFGWPERYKEWRIQDLPWHYAQEQIEFKSGAQAKSDFYTLYKKNGNAGLLEGGPDRRRLPR
jgi:hypothetical protein